MHSYFALKKFKQWLRTNRHRFLCPPYIRRVRDYGFRFGFHGVDQRIFGCIYWNGSATVCINYAGHPWDSLVAFDIDPVKTLEGRYYCALCRGRNPDSDEYTTRLALLINCVWEPMLDWLNQNCVSSSLLCVYSVPGTTNCTLGEAWAKLKSLHEIEQERMSEHFVDSFPVIMRKHINP